MDDKKQPILIFACQPAFLTLGQSGGFENLDDFYRYAVDCGFEGITVPLAPPMFDFDLAYSSKSYPDDLQAHLRKLGFQEGLHRLEFHTLGQNVALHPSRVLRFGHFIDPQGFRDRTHGELEGMAAEQMFRLVDVAAQHKLPRLVGFMGGKGYAVAQAKWSAWPAHLRTWILAAMIQKWETILIYAGERGVTIHPEIGHPENDLLTGAVFVDFYSMLSSEAKKGLGCQIDGSHFANGGVNPIPHFERVLELDVPLTNHYKWGANFERDDGTCSHLGGWDQWSKASSTFYTIGTVGSEWEQRHFHTINVAAHETQDGGNPIVYEGECVAIMDPLQAMKVGAYNCRALRDGQPLIRLDLERESLKWPGQEALVKLDSWAGGPFDAFADAPVKPWELLGLNSDETRGVRAILERAGYPDAAKV